MSTPDLTNAPRITLQFFFSEVCYTLLHSGVGNVRERFFKFVEEHDVKEWQEAIDEVANITYENIGVFHNCTFAAHDGKLYLVSCKPCKH